MTENIKFNISLRIILEQIKNLKEDNIIDINLDKTTKLFSEIEREILNSQRNLTIRLEDEGMKQS